MNEQWENGEVATPIRRFGIIKIGLLLFGVFLIIFSIDSLYAMGRSPLDVIYHLLALSVGLFFVVIVLVDSRKIVVYYLRKLRERGEKA